MKIFDNFLNPIELITLQKWIFDDRFSWVYSSPIVASNRSRKKFQHCFVNQLYHSQESYDSKHIRHPNFETKVIKEKLRPLLNRLSIYSLYRVRTCMYTRTKEPEFHGYHYDLEDYVLDTKEIFTKEQIVSENKKNDLHPVENMKIAIFYLNTNNGQTCLDGERVDAIENRLVCFSNTVRHSSISQTDCDRRIVININYF
jgi:hypothetical protein